MKKRETNVFSIAFLDLLTGALGAVIILFVAVPKAKNKEPLITEVKAKEGFARELTKESIEDTKSDRDAIFNENEELIKKVSQLSSAIEKLKAEKSALGDKLQIEEEKNKARDRKTASIPVDVGFKFKGKKIVFVIDVSGSMHIEDKIGQVKAGLKMLITSMDPEFHIDVVQFPFKEHKSYHPLWKKLRPMNQQNKKEVYQFLHQLRPFGSTPTRVTMKYVLKTYKDATDIVLLSDGAPTKSSSLRQLDDIYSVAEDIRYSNFRKTQISTVGVGSDFLTNSQNPKYIFLKIVAEENKGFFVGF